MTRTLKNVKNWSNTLKDQDSWEKTEKRGK